MHYGQSPFAKIKDDIVIKTKNTDFQELIGNRGDMTPTDIQELNNVYE